MSDDIKNYRLLKLDETTTDNRIYPKSVIQEFLDNRHSDKGIYVLTSSETFNKTFTVDVRDIAGVVENLRIESNWLVGDIRLFTNTLNGGTVMEMMNCGHSKLVTGERGVVDLSEDGKKIIKDYTLMFVYPTLD